MVARSIELPSDGLITREVFEGLPKPSGRWAWELRSGRLGLTHVPVTGWQWLTVVAALEYWRDLGWDTAGDQYVADGGFMGGGAGGTNLVASAVVFNRGRSPRVHEDTHDAADVYAVIEAVSARNEERDAVEKQAVYAQLGVPCYWIIRKESPQVEEDGLISMFELADGEYRLVGHRLVSQLKSSAGAGESQ